MAGTCFYLQQEVIVLKKGVAGRFSAPAASRRTIFVTPKNQRRTATALRHLELGTKERGTVKFAQQEGHKEPGREHAESGALASGTSHEVRVANRSSYC
jgi:hypothetical protein